MLSKPISTRVFEQPELGKAGYQQATAMKAKRDAKTEAVEKDKQNTAEGLAQASAFMPTRHKQVAEAKFGAMEKAYLEYKKTGSQSALDRYNSTKSSLVSTMAVGKAKYDVANSQRQSAYQNGFDGIIGGQEAVDNQWDNVIGTAYDAVEVDESGVAYVMKNGEKVPFDQLPESDVRDIRPGDTDFVLQKQTEVPKISTVVGAQSIYNSTLDEDKSWGENWSKISEQIEVDMDSPDFPKAAAIFYYRKRKGGTGELTDTEVRKAVDMYVNNDKGAALAQQEWKTDLHDRMKQTFEQKEEDPVDFYKGLSQQQKQVIDKPLNEESKTQVLRPDGKTVDLNLYSQDVKSLSVPFDKAEGTIVDKIYYKENGDLDHFLIKVPKGKSTSNFDESDVFSVDKNSDPKYNLVRVFDPREFGNTFGERVSSILKDRVLQKTGEEYSSKLEGESWAEDAVAEM